jgi:PHD/YefM family antitoxin component YafN of YafNO toxin-antitoxin module
MNQLNIEYFNKNFDSVMNQVENGQSFIIQSKHGSVLLEPYEEPEENDIDFLCNHNDGP